MNLEIEAAFGIIFTALLWGITDPLLKKFGQGFDKKIDSRKSGFASKLWHEVLFLLTNWKYVLTFCSNQVQIKSVEHMIN